MVEKVRESSTRNKMKLTMAVTKKGVCKQATCSFRKRTDTTLPFKEVQFKNPNKIFKNGRYNTTITVNAINNINENILDPKITVKKVNILNLRVLNKRIRLLIIIIIYNNTLQRLN